MSVRPSAHRAARTEHVVLAATAVSLVCYVKYYGLSVQAGYWDGMVPLIMAGVYMGILSVVLFI